MNDPTTPAIHVNLPSIVDTEDVINALFFQHFIGGELRWAVTSNHQRVRPGANLLPAGVRPMRVSHDTNVKTTLVKGDGWVLRARLWTTGVADVTVLARSRALADRILADAGRGVTEPVPIDVHRATIGFWHLGGRHQLPMRIERTVAINPWSEIRQNYTAGSAASIEQLMALEPDRLPGRLLLLHGLPGTGKTTALRALTHAWRRWCDVDYVLDPERMFSESGYLLHVALGDNDRDDPKNGDERWRLLVLEDCDELIGAEAKKASGQALARLLNVTDGLLGQGLRLLVAITTNESLARLHPAIVRPGRCLAQIEVGRLTRAEARQLLGEASAVGPEGVTLAELYALRADTVTIRNAENNAAIGMYL